MYLHLEARDTKPLMELHRRSMEVFVSELIGDLEIWHVQLEHTSKKIEKKTAPALDRTVDLLISSRYLTCRRYI